MSGEVTDIKSFMSRQPQGDELFVTQQVFTTVMHPDHRLHAAFSEGGPFSCRSEELMPYSGSSLNVPKSEGDMIKYRIT